ncbi:MAG: hypothetical protein L3J37_03345 [Rhodobacteraceae bacterium]|nr:hypothetical protein [Paracoccaceae bacterium]
MKLRNIGLLLALLPVMACANIGKQGPNVDLTLLEGQPLSRTAERAPPFARRIAQSDGGGLGGGIAGFLIGKAVTATINADERARSRIGEVPTPQNVDPGMIIENTIADYLISRYRARANIREFYAGSVRETGSVERGTKVVELARRRGLNGVIIDVVALEYYADSTGRNLGLFDEAFRVVVSAELNIVDIETGTVLASGTCSGSHQNVVSIASAVEGGPRLTTLLAQKAAADCAAALVRNALE